MSAEIAWRDQIEPLVAQFDRILSMHPKTAKMIGRNLAASRHDSTKSSYYDRNTINVRLRVSPVNIARCPLEFSARD